MCFSAAASSENRPWQHEFGFEYRTGRLNHAVQGRRHPSVHRVLDPPLDILDEVARLPLIPASVEVLGDSAQLNEQVFGKGLRLELAALLPPQPQQ